MLRDGSWSRDGGSEQVCGPFVAVFMGAIADTDLVLSVLLHASGHEGARSAMACNDGLVSRLITMSLAMLAVHPHPLHPLHPPLPPIARKELPMLLLQRLLYAAVGQVPRTSESLDSLAQAVVDGVKDSGSLDPSGELAIAGLGVLATMLHSNHRLRQKLKAVPDANRLYRALIGFLSHSTLHAIVYALSILASLLLR